MTSLVGLFAPQPPPPSQPVRFRQGVILTFDAVTLANTVLVGGTVMTNLPLLGVGESTLLVPGSVVGILAVGEATQTWYITGRIVAPGTPDAANATALLSSQVYADSVATAEAYNSTSFWDLGVGGPQVTVPVRTTGRLLVIASCQIAWSSASSTTPAAGGQATIDMSGANTLTTADAVYVLNPIFKINLTATAAVSDVSAVASTDTAVLEGLNAGDTLVTMRYACLTAGQAVTFSRRTLTVITL
jgi:hypothetical protein